MTVKRLQCFCLILISIFFSPVESCAELRFINPESLSFNTFVNGWINVTFQLDLEKCTEDLQYTVVIETQIKNQNPEIHCKIIHNKTSCSLTDRSNISCHCEPTVANFFKKVEKPGEIVYVWRWFMSNSSKGEQKQNEKSLTFYAAQPEQKRYDNVKFILAGVCGFLVIIVLVLLVCRRLKPRLSDVNGDMKHEKTIENQSTNPETPAPPATGGEMLEAGPEYVVITEDMYCEAWDHVKRSQIPPGAVRVLVDSGPRSFSKK
ncbi:uncharacterized protein LOC112568825 [Pomacea canaliculata]|uniref:uncharacterized protein LOC112568825 n=1 Tax=Pomacea canaliculata TaxID=400727 RepID=UPI000D738C58|nr:uncharacterized protein LOC112568825 [Pomacea canaliculata]XP_025102108.1 uncharacterized protein LOC112568825 [Pomacea canaliculata]